MHVPRWILGLSVALIGCGSTSTGEESQPTSPATSSTTVEPPQLPTTPEAIAEPPTGSTEQPSTLEEMDAAIPVVELKTGPTQSSAPYLGSQSPTGGPAGAVAGFKPATADQTFCWAVEVINSRPQPIDEFEEVVVANRYFEAISPYVPSVVSSEFEILIDFTIAVSAQGSFGETDEVNDDDSEVAEAAETLNVFVDEHCLGRTG